MISLSTLLCAPAVASLVGTVVVPTLLVLSLSNSPPNTSEYDFGSGSTVQIEKIIGLQDRTLMNPKFIGAGGGGAVFTYRQAETSQEQRSKKQVASYLKGNNVVVKFSWLQSAESVTNECNVLQVMEELHVTGVERCLARMDYRPDPRRAVIVMEPYLDDAVSSITELPPEIARKATQNLIRVVVEMLAARVVTVDVQPLISKRTGDLVLIDMTEAKILPDGALSNIDLAIATEFCTEVVALAPDSLLQEAAVAFKNEISRIEQTPGVRLHEDLRNIMETMLSFD